MSTLDWSLQQATKTTAEIAAATTKIPKAGQIVWNTDTGKYCIGDGTTALSALTFYGGISASGLTVGTTTITGGTNTKVLYNNNGVVGEYTVTGSGSVVLDSTLGSYVPYTGATTNVNLATRTLYTSTGNICVGRSNPDRPIEVYSSTGLASMQAYSASTTSYAGVYSQSNNASNYIGLIQTSTSYGFVDGLRIADSSIIDCAGVILGIWNNNVVGDVVIATGGHATANEKLRFTPTTTTFSNSIVSVGNPNSTGKWVLRDMVGIASTSNALYVGTATPTTINHLLAWDTSSTYLNAIGSNSVYIQTGGTNRVRFGSNFLVLSEGVNIHSGTTTGSIIFNTTSQKGAFWGKTPIVQPTTAISGSTLVSNGGTAITSTDTFGGYTLQQLAAIIINTGLAA